MTVIPKSSQPIQHLEGRTLQWLASPATGSTATALLENIIEPSGIIPAHYHPVEELLVCLEGQGQVVVEGMTYPFESGDTAIVHAGLIHSVRNTGRAPLRMLGFFPTNQPVALWVDDQPALWIEG